METNRNIQKAYGNLNFVKLFDSRFVANSLNNSSRCNRCRNEFSYNYDTPNRFDVEQHVKSNRPILLPCGHNMCENCVYHNRSNLTCNVCLSPIMLPKDQTKLPNFNVRDCFEMNFFMMGKLNHWRYFCKDGSANNTMFMSATGRANLSNTFPDADTSAAIVPMIRCVECEMRPSSCKCRACNVYYCKRCFHNIHNNSKVLRAHTMINLDKKRNLQSELVFLTKPRFCRAHRRQCDRYCKKCDMVCCVECACQDHQLHHFRKLTDVNDELSEELQLTVENAQLARENLTKAQKEMKSLEAQFEEYATQTLEQISNHYLQLHSFLQNEEKQILQKFGDMCHMPQFMIRENNMKLFESHEALNSIRKTLEQYEQIPPANNYLGHILPKYNKIIQQIPCYVQINKPRSNPFVFEVKHDVRPDIQNSTSYKYKDPKLAIKIESPFGDTNRPEIEMTTANVSSIFSMTLNKNVSPKPKNNRKNLTNKKHEAANNPDAVTNINAPDSNCEPANLVRITQIISPGNFYAQYVNEVAMIRNLSHRYLCNDNVFTDDAPLPICERCYYMVYHVIDKQWYRGVIEATLPNDVYEAFLVDFGIRIEVSKENIRAGDIKHMQMPHAAIRCTLYDILPAGKKWTEAENNLLLELVQNKPVRASIFGKTDDDLIKIDLHSDLSKSVRNTFLYTGMAREKAGKHSFKMQPKINLPLLRVEDRIPKMKIFGSEILMVKALHIEGPNEFSVVKNDLVDSKVEFERELNQYYSSTVSQLQQIYLGTVQMCCAVKMSGIWYRAVIEEIKGEGQLYVRLVDEGRLELIKWRQAFVLTEEFRNKREFAIPCMLADIEPLQENNYVYTAAAKQDFKQMMKNPQLRMKVVAITPKLCKVVMYICKTAIDINVGEVLVKQKYAASTGALTQAAGIAKTPKANASEEKITIITNLENIKAGAAANLNQVKRTLITVTHLVTPSEFYIQLANLAQGIQNFHQQIQEAQAKKYGNMQPLSCETREWFEDNHCLVYTKQHNSPLTQLGKTSLPEHFEWYRGIITQITYVPGEQRTFSVFLRDIGATVCSICSHQLYSIDAQLDRVTNAVYRCHLACVEPAGGKTWSQSACDSFTYYIMDAETLSVSLHGKRERARAREQKSLAVVLWSSRVETENPLAPCITKYSTINRHLVKKGLAYTTDHLDIKKQFAQLEEIQLENGEITLDEWFKSFSDNRLFKDEKLPQLDATESTDENNDPYVDDHPLNKCLSEMDFTATNGKQAPAAWLAPKDINKTIFNCYVTYIDYDSCVYLHEAEDMEILQKMTKMLTASYGAMEPPHAGTCFELGQACVAKYHADGKYYRGIITADINADSEWGVTFVDYGNVERVGTKDMRPYAPFPNLPAMASKYIIDGIRPKGGAQKFSSNDLDQMHVVLVAKFVSLSVELRELRRKVKRCRIRLGAKDVASEFVERGLAEAVNPIKLDGDEAHKFAGTKFARSRNPLPPAPVDDYAVFDQQIDMSVDCSFAEAALEDVRYNGSSISSDDVDDDNEYDHLNEILDRLSKNADADEALQPNHKSAAETTSSSVNATNKPPPKKRLFNDNDYTKMVNAMVVYDGKADFENIVQNLDNEGRQQHEEQPEEEDFVELGESLVMNYWHNAVEDVREEENEEIGEQLNRRLFSFEDEAESEFESFCPEDTSTIFSHFSGLDNFALPQLPSTMHHFKCRVVFIMTPVILQIFPLHTEFNYRDIDLQRTIKELVKQSLPCLTSFEARTVCLARYTKDKQWYRAVIRSYNPTAKTVDVLYADYLNSETLPLKYVRECPRELLGWPLRTFSVRLHQLNANPDVKELEIRKFLKKRLQNRELFAVVKKHPVFSNSLNKRDHIEVVLYESKEASLKGEAIYDPLVETNYYRRV